MVGGRLGVIHLKRERAASPPIDEAGKRLQGVGGELFSVLAREEQNRRRAREGGRSSVAQGLPYRRYNIYQ